MIERQRRVVVLQFLGETIVKLWVVCACGCFGNRLADVIFRPEGLCYGLVTWRLSGIGLFGLEMDTDVGSKDMRSVRLHCAVVAVEGYCLVVVSV